MRTLDISVATFPLLWLCAGARGDRLAIPGGIG